MQRLMGAVALVLGCSLVTVAKAQEDDMDQYRYKPDFEAADRNPLTGQQQEDFECLDKNGDQLITQEELEALVECLGQKRVDEMGLNARAGIIMERLDADRDREITPREYKTWTQ